MESYFGNNSQEEEEDKTPSFSNMGRHISMNEDSKFLDCSVFDDFFSFDQKPASEDPPKSSPEAPSELLKIIEGLKDEHRVLQEKLRIKLSMRDLRRKQFNSFFQACYEEIERCRHDFTVDLDNDEIIFEQEFSEIEERIKCIHTQIKNAQEIKSPNNSEIEGEEIRNFELEKAVQEIAQNIQKVIEESEGYEKGDYLVAYDRGDLRERMNALCNHSLRYKQNTSLFDFDFENNKVIKTEILQKGTLKEFLAGEVEESQINGIRNPKSFINTQNISKSLLDISVAFTPGTMIKNKGGKHKRNTSNISSSFLKDPNLKETQQFKKYKNDKFKQIEAIRRDIKLDTNFVLPKKLFPLILKEGRTFFIGGHKEDQSSPIFIEYFEESNSIYLHPNMHFGREDHGVCFANGRIYTMGGYDFKNEKWLDTIESIELPQRPNLGFENNYDILVTHEVKQSNQEEFSPRNNWRVHQAKLAFGRSHFVCATQLERYIYVFCGKYGVKDQIQPSLINEKLTHKIECFDTLNDTVEEYTVKSCYKIGKCFSPGCVPIFSPRSKIPGLLLFGGKFSYDRKKDIKIMNKNYLIYPQDQDRCKQLSSKYDVIGCELSSPDLSTLTPKPKPTSQGEPTKTTLFNGNIECLRKLQMYTEDDNYYYFLGCREKCLKLETQDQFVVENKGVLERIFGKNRKERIETNLGIQKNFEKVKARMYGVEKVDEKGMIASFTHPRHGHSLFMLDKFTLKWTSVPVVKYS